MIESKEFALTDKAGKARVYILSKVPATVGREIVSQYPLTALPKVGDYQTNHQMMLKLLSYVGVPQKDKAPLMLVTEELVNNHVDGAENLLRLEKAMFEYNFVFFSPENLSSFQERWKRIFSTFLAQILTQSLRDSSQSE
jgi:hypothetical protein